MTSYQEWRLSGKGISKADDKFYADYINEFAPIGLYLSMIDITGKRNISFERKIIDYRFKKFFECYPEFKERDLSPKILKKVKSLDSIVEKLNKIKSDKKPLNTELIRELYDKVLKIRLGNFLGFPLNEE